MALGMALGATLGAAWGAALGAAVKFALGPPKTRTRGMRCSGWSPTRTNLGARGRPSRGRRGGSRGLTSRAGGSSGNGAFGSRLILFFMLVNFKIASTSNGVPFDFLYCG